MKYLLVSDSPELNQKAGDASSKRGEHLDHLVYALTGHKSLLVGKTSTIVTASGLPVLEDLIETDRVLKLELLILVFFNFMSLTRSVTLGSNEVGLMLNNSPILKEP